LNTRIYSARYRSNMTDARWGRAVKEHDQMLKLLDKRDGAALRALLETHLRAKRDTVMAALKDSAEKAA
jgi:DNA-binding GntR family transcriptional regulator